jgi:putative SOS response-associated peptidase YedK
VNDERDFFGVVTIEEQEYRLIVPADRYYEWLTTVRHNVDETGIIETIREDEAA